MLDSLVRRPGKEEYQLPESRAFLIFGFTSSGSKWKMYVGYLPNCVHKNVDAVDDPLCDDDSVSCNPNTKCRHLKADSIHGLLAYEVDMVGRHI